jgi:hypothetical protein
MDVSIQEINSRVRVVDSEALLSAEVLQRIVTAVKQQLEQDNTLQAERDSDTQIQRGAARLR